MSSSTPAAASACMSRSKNVETRAGYLLVKTASLIELRLPCSPREVVLAQPQLERQHHEDALVQAGPADAAAARAVPRRAELTQPRRHLSAVEQLARPRRRGEQQVVQRHVRLLRDHHVERHGKAVLGMGEDRKSTRLNSSHANISYAVFCLKKKTQERANTRGP